LTTKGDDVILFFNRIFAERIKKSLSLVFAPDMVPKYANYGLGQVLKDLKVGELDDFEFCSMYGYVRKDGTYRFLRVPARLF
jgi:hypothetical protein